MRKPIVKKSLLIFLILATGLKGTSQFTKKPFIIEPKLHAGMTVPLYQALAYLVEDDIYAFDIAFTVPTYGTDFWEKLYNYPRTGIGFSHWSLGNNEIFGKAYALYNFINLPLLKRSGRFSLNYQISFGGAYITKKFDIDTNPLNRAVGSHTNVYLRLGVDGRIKLTQSIEMVFEAGAAHFSNGKTRSPNYGINLVSSSIGINYLFNSGSFIKQDPVIPPLIKHNVQSVILTAGSKVYDNLLDKRFLTSSLSYNFERFFSLRRKIGIGADLFYDGSISDALAVDGIPEDDYSKFIRLGLHASYAIRYKDMMMGVQLGHYLYSKYKVLTNVYSRISVQYLVTKNIFLDASIKAHYGKADSFEIGLGYCL